MNEKLARLIFDFQEKILVALKIMHRSGIPMPLSCNHWIELDIPISGELDNGVKYHKHGAGCLVRLSSGDVDFDFGAQGEVGGFNLWRLTLFAGDNLSSYGFKNKDEVADCLNNALDKEQLVCIDYDLYYISNAPFFYAVDIDSRHPGDKLPNRNQDRVLVLLTHYFQSAELMFKNYEKIRQKSHINGHLSERDEIDLRIYLSTWLGFLGVVCEGVRKLNLRILLNNERPDDFKELLPISNNIGRLMKEHADSLRTFRNNVFHLRENTEYVYDFFDVNFERLPWARELHMALSDFFIQYRIHCEVHYVINGRKGESDFINKKGARRKR